MSLQDFVGYARLLGGAQDAYCVRRIVEPTLAQLHVSSHLHRYDVVDTGPNTQVVLDFGDATQIVNHHSVKLLESLSVAHRMALQLALGHSRAED